MGFHWPFYHQPEPVADPVLVNKLCEQAVRIATLEAVIEQQRLHPKGVNGKFVNRQDATTAQLRGEMQAKANAPLDEALEAQRIASRFAPEKGQTA